MTKLLRLIVLASVVAGLFGVGGLGAGTAAAAPLEAPGSTRLILNPPNGSGILSGYLVGIDPSLAFVTVTVTLRDGSNLSVNVDSSTGWSFSFGVLPPDGFVSLSLTENPIPMPQLIGNDWDYGYLHGYFYAYPFGDVPWSAFRGYAYPAGYGWGNYPFGYYAYPQQLYSNYRLPYFWNYAPIYNTAQYTYYGVAGLARTYYPPSYSYSAFGTITQPYYVQNYSLTNYNPLFTLPNPVLVSQNYVAPYLGQAAYAGTIYTAPAIQTVSTQPVQTPTQVQTTTQPVFQTTSGTNLYQGSPTTSVPQVNLPQYALPTNQTANPPDPKSAPVAAQPNLYQGQGAKSGVPSVNIPSYAPTAPPPNLYQGGASAGGSPGGVQNVNLPQYAPKLQATNAQVTTTNQAQVQSFQPVPQPKIAPTTPAPPTTGQSGGATNLWHGSNTGATNTNYQQHQVGSVHR